MEVFRQNLQLLEEQQLSVTAAGGQLGPSSAPPPATPTTPQQPGLMTPARSSLLVTSDQLGTEIATGPPLHLGPGPQQAAAAMLPVSAASVYALAAAQSNLTNNNSLQYPGNLQLKPFPGGQAGVQSPSSISVPAAPDLTRPSYVYHPLCATQMPRPPIASAPGPCQSPAAPVMISTKLKATPTLISIQSSRDHKFMPYWVTQLGLRQR